MTNHTEQRKHTMTETERDTERDRVKGTSRMPLATKERLGLEAFVP